MSVNWTRPFQAKLPYTPWGEWKLSQFAKKIRQALGWRLDENDNNTTYRSDLKDPTGTAYPDKSNLCHHFQQDSATADAVHLTVKGGKAININVPSDAGDDQVIFQITKGDDALFQITGNGKIRLGDAATDIDALTDIFDNLTT